MMQSTSSTIGIKHNILTSHSETRSRSCSLQTVDLEDYGDDYTEQRPMMPVWDKLENLDKEAKPRFRIRSWEEPFDVVGVFLHMNSG